MSWSDRRSLLLGLMALAGCGFQPALGPGAPARGLMNAVLVDAPGDKDAYDLVERLEERLGRSQTPAYRLSYRISTGQTGLGITPEGATTRYNLDGSVTYTLEDIASGTQIAAGRVESFTSWSATGSTLSTLGAEQDARRRLMHILADQIVTRLIAGRS
ncbi:LPS assembly lipoprotein LptE [Halodurantibacterium flavum]|uniref:LPS assembly lipoprotein LptE n=1 Tax=Halodurantibacterium flavum TaxID=1382802 RepID=A0ABW4S6Q6_9RHOB